MAATLEVASGWPPGTAAALTEKQLVLYYTKAMDVLQMRALSLFGGGSGGSKRSSGMRSGTGDVQGGQLRDIFKEMKAKYPERDHFTLKELITFDVNRRD